MLFPGVGKKGQENICKSRVTVVGCGALGTVIASTLVRAGVGFVRVVDRDFIEFNNLQRQVLFDENDIKQGYPKAVAAANKLREINSQVEIESVVADVNYKNIEQLIDGADLILDGTDNFETRFLINDACIKHKQPWIYGGCVGSHGLSLVVIPGETPCLRCVFETQPPAELTPTCDTAGIISPIVNMIASLQVTETLKFLAGNKKDLLTGLYTYDIWTREAHSFKTQSSFGKVDCICCQRKNFEFLEGTKGSRATTLCGRSAVQISSDRGEKIDFKQLASRLETVGKVKVNAFMLKCEIDEFELTLFPDGRAIIKGTTDPAQAKTIYAKYVSG